MIGLGAGTIASYGRRGDTLTFVEIDPLVVRIAQDADLFTYLRDAPSGPPTIVVGDGRLELEAQPPASEELVVLDAFSSDAMPIHLMTTEALAAATRTLTHDGLLAVNISSRSYALGPTIAAGVAPLGLTALERLDQPTTEEAARGITTSDWVVAVLRPDDVAWFTDHGWTVLTPAATPFTDDRSDIIRLLRPDILW